MASLFAKTAFVVGAVEQIVAALGRNSMYSHRKSDGWAITILEDLCCRPVSESLVTEIDWS